MGVAQRSSPLDQRRGGGHRARRRRGRGSRRRARVRVAPPRRRSPLAFQPAQPERPPGPGPTRSRRSGTRPSTPWPPGSWTRGDGPRGGRVAHASCWPAPGCALGYVLGDPDLVARCRDRQPAWSVGALAAAALPELLATVDLPGLVCGHRGAAGRAHRSAGVVRTPRPPLGRQLGPGRADSRASRVARALRRRGPRLRQLRPAGGDTHRGPVGSGSRASLRCARKGPAAPPRVARTPGAGGMSWRRPVPLVGDASSARCAP